jgi:hypothetical protein
MKLVNEKTSYRLAIMQVATCAVLQTQKQTGHLVRLQFVIASGFC